MTRDLKRTALIYNPWAGRKRQLLPNQVVSLEEIIHLLNVYEIFVDTFPTKHAGHATALAKNCVKKGYSLIIVAGGDGTISEVASGMINTKVPLGILPIGSFMNIAKMLAIPDDIERAISLLKIKKITEIDVGVVTKLGEDTQEQYFIENASIGIEAHFQQQFLNLERGHLTAFIHLLRTIFDYFKHPTTIQVDDHFISTKAQMITISNGPMSGANFSIAPLAKLNDHYLTLSLFKMNRWQLLKYFFKAKIVTKFKRNKQIAVMQAKKIIINSQIPRPVHADARIFGTTPAEFSIIPNALTVISGYPVDKKESALIEPTYLSP